MAMKRLATLSTVVLTLALAPVAQAQDFDLTWHTIDGGGETFTSGGDFELSGTIGQPDAGTVMTGGDFTLSGGFWAGGGITPPPCPADLNGDGHIGLGDLTILLAHYGGPGGPADGDLNGDGFIDLADLTVLLAVYGTPCP